MSDTRHKNARWNIRLDSDGHVTWDGVHAAILMDIRDELQAINSKLNCYRIPRALDALQELGLKLRREKRARRKRRK